MTESESSRVLELAEEFIERYRRGERPALTEYIQRHPDLEAEIREVFPAMALLENIAIQDGSLSGSASGPGTLPATLPVPQLGDYRIIREVGRGGMGVVYEAEQVSLGRHVALKVLPKQLRDAKQRIRFEREAKAAAKLHHTNIVPVFGVGEQDGQPYYVMQFIQGLGLDSVLDELNRMHPGSARTPSGLPTGGEIRVARRDVSAANVARSLMTGAFEPATDIDEAGGPNPLRFFTPTLEHAPDEANVDKTSLTATSGATRLSDSFTVSSSSLTLPSASKSTQKSSAKQQTYWQSVASIGRQVADALDYAHKHGILHRDIKPSNLLLDLRGTVWVTDFGLAKVAGPGSDDLTHTGDVLGTLRYMPPEAFEGTADARGDVYSLGLTLYELLAQRPAFPEKDRHKLIKQVTSSEPAALGKVRHEIPRDLVTIVQKSIEREPNRRYATAEDFASDLQRFIDDEPIQARRQTHIERYWRWARHHPTIAVLGGVLTAVLVIVTVASLVVAGRMSKLAEKETQAAADERISRQLAVEARERETMQRAQAQTATLDAQESKRQTEAALTKALKAEAAAIAEGKRADREAEIAQRNLFHAQMHLGLQAWREHRGLGHMRELLDNWLPKDDSLDRRGWEWFYLNSLPYQNVQTLTEGKPGGRPTTVAWHAGTNSLAEGTAEGSIRIWDVEREHVTLTVKCPAPTGTFWGQRWLAWNSAGSQLAAGSNDGSVRIWAIPSGKELRVLREHKSPIITVEFDSDSKRLAAWATNGQIKLWDAETGQVLDTVVHPTSVTAGAWSPDNRWLATGHNNGTVTIAAIQPGGKKFTLRAHRDTVYHLAWRPDSSRLVTTGGDFTIRIWDVESEKEVVGPMRHSHGVATAAWAPDGKRLATGSFDETIKIWDAETGREELTLRGHTQSVISLAWGTFGRMASGGIDGSMKIWTAVRAQEWSTLPGNGVRVTAVAWRPDGKFLASGDDNGHIRIWDAATRREIQTIKGHDPRKVIPQYGLIRSVAWSPDGSLIASAGLDGAAKVWDSDNGQEVFAFPANRGSVWSVAWSPDGTRLAAGSEDGSIRTVEGLKDKPRISEFKAHQRRARGLSWSPNGDRLSSVGLDGFVKIWDPVRRVELVSKQGHHGGVFTTAWSRDGKRLVSAGNDRFIIAWDATTGERSATMTGHNDWIDGVVWSPDGMRLASAGIDNSVRIWDALAGKETFALRGTSGMFHDVAWHPRGAQLAAASSDGQIWIWDATQGFERDTTARGLPYIEQKLASKPANNPERLRVAQLAFNHKRFAMATRLWSEAFASAPTLADERQTRRRLNAARAACLTAAGQGAGEPPPDAVNSANLRRQAIDWLRAELTTLGQLINSSSAENVGDMLLEVNAWRFDAALAALHDTESIDRLPADERKLLTQFWADVAVLLRTGSAKQEVFLKTRVNAARENSPNDSVAFAYLLAQLGRALLEQQKWTEAEAVLRECLAIREKELPDAWSTFNTQSSLGGALSGQKKYVEAEPLLAMGYTGMKEREQTMPTVGKDRLPEAVDRLVEFYKALGKPDEMKKWTTVRASLLRTAAPATGN